MSRADYEKFFRDADVNGNGSLSPDELKTVLTQNACMSDETFQKFYGAADLSNDRKVTMDEFLAAMDQLPEADHKKASLRRAYNLVDTDGSGQIEADELRTMLGSIGEDLTDAQLERMRDQCDTDQDGKFEFEEFVEKFF